MKRAEDFLHFKELKTDKELLELSFNNEEDIMDLESEASDKETNSSGTNEEEEEFDDF